MPPIMRSTPARLTETGTTKLPRLALFGLAFAYIVAGLFMRDPWKTDDVVGLATMITALHEGTWLLPQIGHLAYAQEGPLLTWVGAVAIKLFGPFLGEFTAGRLPNLLWFAMSAVSVWYGTYLVGRRAEAQPLALPFGGEPPPRAYGRMLADAALLLLLATVGILQRMHETSVLPAVMAWQALVFYALTRMPEKPITGALTLGLAIAGSFLTRGWLGGLPVMVGTLVAFIPPGDLRARLRWLPLALLVAAGLILAWWIPATHASDYWVRNWKAWNLGNYDWPAFNRSGRALRDLTWFLWPTWPLALVAVWRWRAWLFSTHIWPALSLAACALLQLFFVSDPDDGVYIMLAVPCASLAALSLPTLRRGVINTLDWFAVMCFSLTAITAWLAWVAVLFGMPAQISRNIARHTAGYVPPISWLALLLAAAITVAWIALIVWRLRVRPTALWRGTVLSASGLAAT
ncbi:MAG TPA: glycosyltransferase, partial [Bordetella sp.]